MHNRPHCRKEVFLLRGLRSRKVFAPVRPRLARWEHKRLKPLLFENARYLKTLIRYHFLQPFYFDLSDRSHIRAHWFNTKTPPPPFRDMQHRYQVFFIQHVPITFLEVFPKIFSGTKKFLEDARFPKWLPSNSRFFLTLIFKFNLNRILLHFPWCTKRFCLERFYILIKWCQRMRLPWCQFCQFNYEVPSVSYF